MINGWIAGMLINAMSRSIGVMRKGHDCIISDSSGLHLVAVFGLLQNIVNSELERSWFLVALVHGGQVHSNSAEKCDHKLWKVFIWLATGNE
jgi:hypothetical protein